jgi:alpha,alpha-trehalose-phosphate synthase [UDP-forming]
MRLFVVSNRLPLSLAATPEGWEVRAAAGGLVSALGPLLRQQKGLWLGWPGSVSEELPPPTEALRTFAEREGYSISAVYLTPAEEKGFYQGFSNEVIWPLFHDLQSRCNFMPDYWSTYQAVQEKFVEAIQREIQPNDFLWVQDYQLMGLGKRLRDGGCGNRIAFFLHIPFPPPDIFLKLPWREELLDGLLAYDLVGFQTARDRENFLDCIRRLIPRAKWRARRGTTVVVRGNHRTSVGVFPIGIDYHDFAAAAATPEATERVRALRREMPTGQIILSVDRLDYTKGIPQRLRAFELALKRFPELHRNITLLQVVIPSREAVPEYQDLKAEIEQLVSQINGQFTLPGWVPIHHVFRPLTREELVAYYRVADVALVTPLKDGMNLVSKEYCACQIDGDGVLILSEFAGAADQLRKGAIVVNPYDSETVAVAIRQAANMTAGERQPGMHRLRKRVQREDVYWWCDQFLRAAGVSGVKFTPGGGPAVVPSASPTLKDGRDEVQRSAALIDAGPDSPAAPRRTAAEEAHA